MADNENAEGQAKPSDEIIALDKLVSVEPPPAKSSVAGAPVPPPKAEAKPPPAGASAAPPASSGDFDELDRLLAIEDPTFTDSLKELAELTPNEHEVGIDSDLEAVLKRERLEAGAKGPKKIWLAVVIRPMRRLGGVLRGWKTAFVAMKANAVPALKTGAIAGFTKLKQGAQVVLGAIKSTFKAFADLPRSSKLLVFAVAILAGLSAAVGVITFERRLLPSFQTDYMTSVSQIADAEYAIAEDETWQNLNDPFLHPEHIVMIERIVANLRRNSPSPNPMTMMELYIETSSQDAAIELRDREGEARDVIGRTLNRMPYDELTSAAGKNKLKVFLRQDLNSIMTKGRIRRVFFKSLILKP